MGFTGTAVEKVYEKALDLSSAKWSESGFLIKQNGKCYVVTNYHVVMRAAPNARGKDRGGWITHVEWKDREISH